MADRCFALIPAAGVGARMGGAMPKQYLPAGGVPLIAHTVTTFASVAAIAHIHVVLAPDDRRFASIAWDSAVRERMTVEHRGGASRHATVRNGLAGLATRARDDDWVLVHDAARCGITTAMIEHLVATLEDDAVGGLLALPVADTIKRGESDGEARRVAATLDRTNLWQAQTPQMFRYRLLCDALDAAAALALDVTDEASAVEYAGHRPRLVEGSARNFKVTTRDDLAMMSALLSVHPS